MFDSFGLKLLSIDYADSIKTERSILFSIMSRQRGILVTGAHRSGSTWVGRMLAHSHEVQYIHEPFNLKCRRGICRANFERWYSYVDRNVDDYHNIHSSLSDTLSFRYAFASEFRDLSSARDLMRAIRDALEMGRGRFFHLRPLMKDPLALFSSEWLSSSFDMDVVILIRHPAAFASSLKVKGWSFPFSHLLNQKKLMDRYLNGFREELRDYSNHEKDIVSQSILLWKITHHVISKYQEVYPHWLYLRHEDLSRNPSNGFSQLYEHLGLEFSPDIQARVEASSGRKNPTETSQNIHNVNRDSVANIWNWKNRLSQQEIQRIYEGVGELGKSFYGDEDWKLS